MDLLARALATTLFTGLCPFAPGTVGAAVAVGVIWFMSPVPLAWLLGATIALFPVAVWASGEAEHVYGHDARKINLDEVTGMLCTAALLPPGTWPLWVGFGLFRLFDVLKPFPANRAQSLPGGWGVVADDVVAGVYAGLTVRLGVWALNCL